MAGGNLIRGPVVDAAGAGVAIGAVGGYVAGAVASIFSKADPLKWTAHGAGLVGTFAVALVLWPTIGL